MTNSANLKRHSIVAACALALGSMAALATAQTATAPAATTTMPPATSRRMANEVHAAAKHVNEAVKVVQKMERDPGMTNLLQEAKGIFIVPKYGRAALVVGARGGAGVVLAKHMGTWTDPAFYNIGGISVGAQAGIEGGAVALILNTDKALKSFMQENNWSLNADAGLTVVNWSAKSQASTGKGDVVIWSDTKGLLGSLAISVTDIKFDRDETAAYYGKQVALANIFDGSMKGPGVANDLKQALAGGSGASTSSGSSGKGSEGMSGSKGMNPDKMTPGSNTNGK